MRLSRLLILNAILVLVSGCSSTNVINLEGSDTTRFSDVRLSFPVIKEDENKRIKLRLTDASGEFSQDIPEGKVVDFEDFQLVGPDQVSSVANITVASISYGRVGEALRENFFLSAFAGISRTNFEIDMETESGQITGVRNKSFEVYIDLGIYHMLLPYLTGGLEAAFSRNLSLSGITEWGFVLKFRPSKHMEIMGGYRWFKYDYFTTDYDSGIIVELNGPFIGLNLPF